MSKNNHGFTLLELLLTIATLSILFGIGLPIYRSVMVRNNLEVSGNLIARSCRRAAFLSQAGENDNTWGVYLQTGSLTIFQGTSYAARVTTYDELYDIPESIVPSGLTEITFNKLTGSPISTGTITLTTNTNETATLVINSQGTITY